MKNRVKSSRTILGAGTSDAGAFFGPAPHNAWQVNSIGLSLVRKQRQQRPIRFEAQPQTIEIDFASSALIVVDMQNDFCHPDGWFGQKGINVRPMRKPIPAIAELLQAWRAACGLVVWVNWGVRPDLLNLSPMIQFKGKRAADGVGVGFAERSPKDRGLSLVQGHWGAQVVDELPIDPQDITIFKHRLSGFWDNELDTVLRQQGITTLFFAGVNTDRCVFSSLQDAAFLGYDCVLLADACSTPAPAFVTKAIHLIVQQLHGFVAKTTALLPALKALKQDNNSKVSPSMRKKRNSITTPAAANATTNLKDA